MQAAIQAVDPQEIVYKNLMLTGDQLQIGEVTYDLSRSRNIVILAVGKAGAPMAQATVSVLGELVKSGLVIIKPGYDRGIKLPESLQVVKADHPIPGAGSLEAGRQAAKLVAHLDENDLLLCLISGGGSSLCVSPVDGIQLADLQKLNSALLACGAEITEINAVRKHLETLKGGGLVRLAGTRPIASLILSDVVGDPIDGIASGLTAPDPTTFSEALQVLERYQIPECDHAEVFEYFRKGLNDHIEETPKPEETIFENVHNQLVGSNLQAAQAALEKASEEGLNTLLLTSQLRGEARQAGRFLASIIRQVVATSQPIPRPACLIAGGETTVQVTGPGLGGRNLELALAAVNDLARYSKVALITLATDGGDGNTDAAGAVVTGETLEEAHQLGFHPTDYLQRNDSYHFFAALDDLLKPGPTMTNVNDLAFLFVF